MRASIALLSLLVLAVVCSPPQLHSQCSWVSCTYGTDFCGCAGFSGSSRCKFACNCAPVVVSYLDTLHPGLFFEENKGRKVVISLIPGSPAEKAGDSAR
jgi:hypothetical protein